MGSHCSSVKSSSVVQPFKKVNGSAITPAPHDKNSAWNESQMGDNVTNFESNKSSRGFVAESFLSPEHALGVMIKHKMLGQEAANEEAIRHGSISHLNETNGNISRTTAEASNVKRLFQYKKGPLIGKGTYGEVYECLNLNTGELLAVKSFKIHGDLNKVLSYVETMKKEVTLLRNLVNPNIVKYFSTDIVEVREPHSEATVDIVLEYVSGGSVRKLLDKFSKLEEKVVGTYTRQVLEGLTYLHMNGIVHRNIKGSNILIDTTGIIKLTDFGCSGRPDRFSEDNVQSSGFLRGAAYWSAPEVVMRKSQGKPADVWGVGCVVLEMLTGLPPWSTTTRSMEEFVHQIGLGTPPPFPNDISENCRDFLYKTFKYKPEDRPSPLELLDHPFVREDLQETSYMEAESLQTMQTFQTFTPGRVLDLLNSESKFGEKKYMDLKTNNFVQKEPTSNLSMSNINLGRLASQATGEYSATTGMLGRLDSKEKNDLNRGSSFERDRHLMGRSARTKRFADNNLGFVVSEVNVQEEYSPGPNLTGNFRNQYDSIRKGNNAEQDDAQAREARRKQLEEELNKDLMRINTGQLSEYGMIEEKSDREENDEPAMSPEVMPEQFKKKLRPVPIQNSLFAGEKIESKGDKDNSGDKLQNRNMEKGEIKPLNNFLTGFPAKVGDVSTTKSVQVEKLGQREKLDEDLGNSGGKSNVASRRKISENISPIEPNNEEEIQRQKEKLRKQFEEQMELSLARVDSGKLAQVLDKEYQSEQSEFIDNKVEGLRKQNFEEESYHFVGISGDNFRDTWKISEDHMIDMDKMTQKKFEEDLLGGLKEEGDESGRGIGSPQITESDGRSPDNKTKRKHMDFVKFSAKGVINEAEEMKEDSFEGEVPSYKPSSKQNI